MAKTKRVFREWQHPRDHRGRFARKGSPEWVRAAAAKFRAADEALKAGTSAPGMPGGNRRGIARGAKAERLFAAHDASVTTGLGRQPVQGPARPKATAGVKAALADATAKGEAFADTKASVKELSSMRIKTSGFDDKRIQALAAEMRRNGFRGGPIQVEATNRENIVTDGHHRLAAAEMAGIESVPVRVFTNTPEGRRAANRAMADTEAAKSSQAALRGRQVPRGAKEALARHAARQPVQGPERRPASTTRGRISPAVKRATMDRETALATLAPPQRGVPENSTTGLRETFAPGATPTDRKVVRAVYNMNPHQWDQLGPDRQRNAGKAVAAAVAAGEPGAADAATKLRKLGGYVPEAPGTRAPRFTESDIADIRGEYSDLKDRIGQREGVGGDTSKLRARVAEIEATATEHGFTLQPPRRFGRRASVDTPRANGQAGGMPTTTGRADRTPLNPNSRKAADIQAVIDAMPADLPLDDQTRRTYISKFRGNWSAIMEQPDGKVMGLHDAKTKRDVLAWIVDAQESRNWMKEFEAAKARGEAPPPERGLGATARAKAVAERAAREQGAELADIKARLEKARTSGDRAEYARVRAELTDLAKRNDAKLTQMRKEREARGEPRPDPVGRILADLKRTMDEIEAENKPQGAIERASDAIAAQRGLPTGRAGLDELAQQTPGQREMDVIRTTSALPPAGTAVAYDQMDRSTLLILARQAKIPVREYRGKDNAHLAGLLRAKDEQNKAAKAAKLNPSSVGESSTQHETHTPTGAGDPSMMKLSDERLAQGLQMYGTDTPQGQKVVVEMRRRGIDPNSVPKAPEAAPATRKAAKAAPTPAEPQPRYEVARDYRRGSGTVYYDLTRIDPDGTRIHLGSSQNRGDLEKRRRTLEAELGPVIPSTKLEAEKAKLTARLAKMQEKRAGVTGRRRFDIPQSQRDVMEKLAELEPRLARSRREERAAAERANPRGLGGMTGLDPRVVDQLVKDNLANSERANYLDAKAASARANGSVPEGVARAARKVSGDVDHDSAARAEYRRLLGLPTPGQGDEVIEVDASEVRFGDIVSVGGFGMQVATITGSGDTREVSGVGSVRDHATLTGRVKVRRPKAEATQEAAPEAKAPVTWIDKATGREVTNPGQVGIVRGDIVKADSDAGRAAVAARAARGGVKVDTPRAKSQNGGESTAPTTEAAMVAKAKSTGEPQLGVTESSKGRTTTITLPDGTTATRTSKTMAYTHAVVATTDQRGVARDLRASAQRSDEFIAALQRWVSEGADVSKLEKHRTANLSMLDRREGRSPFEYYLPGFGPVQHERKGGRFGGGGTYLNDDHQYGIPDPADKQPLRHGEGKTAYEQYGPQHMLKQHGKMAAETRDKADKLDAGPAETHAVYRWSQSLSNAMKGRAEFEQIRNTRLQIVGVGGVAKETPKAAKAVPTAEEKAAAKAAKATAEATDRAARNAKFFADTRAQIEQDIREGRDPEGELKFKTEAGLRSLAREYGVKLPRLPRDAYGQSQPLDRGNARKLIVEKIRADMGAPNARQQAVIEERDQQATAPVGPGRVKPSEIKAGDMITANVLGIGRAKPVKVERVEPGARGGIRIWVNGEMIGLSPNTRVDRHGGPTNAPEPQGLREPFNPRVANGGTPLPRLEGETDTAYTLRTAPSDHAAETMLNGYTVGGLRAIARDNNVSVPASAGKAQLVAAIKYALRQRWLDSKAIAGQ